MAGLKEIKTRINSVTSTQKMTKAMKMISVVRLRSAQKRIINLRSYANSLEEVLKDVTLSHRATHPFLKQKPLDEIKNTLTVVMTSDRGLCGGFNGNICRFTERLLKESSYKAKDLFFIGKKGSDYFRFRGVQGVEEPILNLVKEVSYPLAAKISKDLIEKTLSKNYDAVFIVYNEFKSIITPKIVCERFLPLDLSSERLSVKRDGLFEKHLIFEVKPKQLIESLLEKYFSIQIYRCLSENVAAEHGSRMAAMESATKNAGDMISSLTLKFNKIRQSAITTELTEIVAGAEALK